VGDWTDTHLDFTATQLSLPSVSGHHWQTKEGSFVVGCNGTSFPIPPALSQPQGLFRRRLEMCVPFSYLTHCRINRAMDRAIIRHVRWHVHATGTWKPPLAPESDYCTEGEEEDRVSDCHPTSCLYTLLWGTRPQKTEPNAPTNPSATTP